MSKNGKTALIVAGAGFVLCLAARLVTILFFTDMNTGFLNHGSEILCNLMIYGVLAASAIVAGVLLRKEPSGVKVSGNGCLAIGFVTLLAAVCAGYEGITETSALTPSLFLIITDFFGAVYMAALAFVLLYKKAFTPALGFCYSIIGVYCVFRGIYVFMNRMVIAAVPEYLAEVLEIVFLALFFAMFARVFSGNEEKLTKPFMFVSGVGAAILTLSTSLGVIFSSLFAPAEISERISASTKYAEVFYQNNHGRDGYIMTFTPYVNMALGLLAAVGVVVALKTAKAEEPTVQLEEQPEAQSDNQ
ncbi:MAG: hypothetical protein ACI4JZ_05525 [Oscillospiraceae bacterium]